MTIKVDRDRNRVEARMEGQIDLPRVLDAYRDMLDHPDFLPGMDALWEFAGVIGPALSEDEVRQLIAVQRGSLAHRGNARIAIVVQRDLDYGVVRMYEALVQELGLEARAFRSRAGAEAWLDAGSEPAPGT